MDFAHFVGKRKVVWDLCSGLGGWTEAFAQSDWVVIRIEINRDLEYVPFTRIWDVKQWMDWIDWIGCLAWIDRIAERAWIDWIEQSDWSDCTDWFAWMDWSEEIDWMDSRVTEQGRPKSAQGPYCDTQAAMGSLAPDHPCGWMVRPPRCWLHSRWG